MPQLPTSTAEEYGAEDEIKQYNQEEDDCSDTSTVDVVNDIKGDLLNEDGPDTAKTNDENLYRNSTSLRYEKSESGPGLYGSPAAVIVAPHNRYYDHSSSYRFNSSSSQPYPSNPYSRQPSVYSREKPYYDHTWGQSPPSSGIHPQYPMHYGALQQKYFRYSSGMNGGVPFYAAYPSMVGRPAKEMKRPHVKKPLNAFMLYMKEQRPKIAAEFTLKESAAINQILGKRWHALEKTEQAKYYEMARKERAIHMQLYPGWSARDNYAQIGRKKKRPRDKNEEINPKKCRARYGLDRQEQWCKPCRRKKKCIRFIIGTDGEATEVPEKDQHETNSDSENEITETNQPVINELDSKEHLQDLVSMAASPNELKNNNNNKNDNIISIEQNKNIRSTPPLVVDTTLQTPTLPSSSVCSYADRTITTLQSVSSSSIISSPCA